MLTAIFVLLLVLLFAYWYRNFNGEAIITEVMHHEPEHHHDITGNLKRQFENDQGFVIDPVDQKKMFINSNDDMYEDANGKIWRLYS